MKRNAFKMKLLPGKVAEYKDRHDNIWPELSKSISDAGIKEYSIFLDEETNTLFACLKLDDHNTQHKLIQSSIMKKWWAYMADIMEVNEYNSPKSKELKEVFFLQ